ncbi:MAG: stage III sporulation protein AF [Clostridia bacterium]|nr:stage III sporulation protein AF [Clostridia bacterium]
MEALKEWFMAITGVLILSMVGEGILPSGTVKKYVTILFGLLLTITICSPFTNKIDFDVKKVQQTALKQVENMEEKESETVLRLYKANIAKKMNTDLKSINENCEYEFMLEVEKQNMEKFGEIRGVIVTVRTTDESLCIDDKIEAVISEKYGVDRKNIAVKYISE